MRSKDLEDFSSTPSCSLLQRVVHCKLLQNLCLTSFTDLSSKEHLIHNCVDLVKVEDQVQLTDVVKVFVQHLHKVVDGLEVVKVIVTDVDTDAEVEASVPAINYFEVPEFDKICVLCISYGHHCVDFLNQLLLLFIVKVHIPLCQPGLARPVLNHHKPDHPQLEGGADPS